MTNLLKDLIERKVLTTEWEWLADNIVLLNVSGSTAYGISGPSSDIDIVGIAIQPKELIYGYDKMFDEFQRHHVKDGDVEYDFKIYSIGKFFTLAENGNPNILDFALTPEQHCLYQTNVGKRIREFAPNFCSKQSVGRYFGFAENHLKDNYRKRQDLSKISEKRRHLYEKFGYDTKDVGHCVRAILCLQDMLQDGIYSVDTNCEFIRDIREGKFTLAQMVELIDLKKEFCRELEETSTLRDKPDHTLCRNFLVSCLKEFHNDEV